MEITIQDLMDRLPKAFVPEKAAGVNASVLFHLTGEMGGDWVVTIKDQTCVVTQGRKDNTNLIFAAEAQDCLDIFTGKLDEMRAFMQGKLRLTGDMGLATKLAGFFDVQKAV